LTLRSQLFNALEDVRFGDASAINEGRLECFPSPVIRIDSAGRYVAEILEFGPGSKSSEVSKSS